MARAGTMAFHRMFWRRPVSACMLIITNCMLRFNVMNNHNKTRAQRTPVKACMFCNFAGRVYRVGIEGIAPAPTCVHDDGAEALVGDVG